MLPVVTPAEMAAVDAAAPEPVDVLIERAGWAVARAAVRVLGGTYGRRVVVLAGPGNNGRDGSVAGRLLARRGAAVVELDVTASPTLPPSDLVIDAAFGTGFRDAFHAPDPRGAPVLAVDIPSGVSGLTGEVAGRPYRAVSTVTFAALKPGLLLMDGPAFAGAVEVADIGLDVGSPALGLVESSDVTRWVPARAVEAHKWRSAVWVVGGSPTMTGAPALAARGAFSAGAGYVRLTVPGSGPSGNVPPEVVLHPVPMVGWADAVRSGLDRIAAVVLGPGLGRDESVRAEVTRAVTSWDRPVVVDGDALWAISHLKGRMSDSPRVITPHDGEYAQLAGRPPGTDRVSAARRLAAERSATVLLKGPTTVIADERGRACLVNSGDQRLATAGSGDVLAGVLGALLATGCPPFEAAAAAAHVHGLAGARGPLVGTTASALPPSVSAVLSELAAGSAP